jgi:hypothetical protein
MDSSWNGRYVGPNSLNGIKQDEIKAVLNFALYFLFLYTLLNIYFSYLEV